MKRLAFLVVVFFLFAGAVLAETPKSLVRIEWLSPSQIRMLASADYDVTKTGRDFIEMVVSTEEKNRLKDCGHKLSEIIPDLDAYIARVKKTQTKEAAYFTYDTMTSKLKDWTQKYASIARLSSLGKSCEGREIWAVKVSDNPDLDEKEPAALIMGAHHAREWISVEVPMEALKQYLDGYGKDERLTRLINEREVWFVPMVNPDGVTYSQNKSKYWRKNRHIINGADVSVDLNRNYGLHWGPTGCSDSPSSDVYHGKGPFTEPEVVAIKELADKEHFQTSLAFHSYSELVLYPYAYAYNAPCEDAPLFKKFGAELAALNGYTPQICTDLYPAMGISDDWLYSAHKTIAFTIELAQTFIPPAAEIVQVNKRNVPAVFYLIEKAGEYGVTAPTGNTEIAANLDLSTALAALQSGEQLLPMYGEDSRLKIADHLRIAGKRVAELVVQDLVTGSTESWEKVKKESAAAFVKPMIRQRVLFEAIHGRSIHPNILSELSLGQ